jgi:hypothetical protein
MSSYSTVKAIKMRIVVRRAKRLIALVKGDRQSNQKWKVFYRQILWLHKIKDNLRIAKNKYYEKMRKYY